MIDKVKKQIKLLEYKGCKISPCKIFGHQWRIKQRSNVIQFDNMGYPLRLFICECKCCMKSEQMWIDSTECKNDVVLQWYDDDYIPMPQKSRK